MLTNLKYVPAKGIITKSKLPDTDYVVNPYIGCAFGCSYCYASFMGRRVNESIGNWGNYLYLKENCVSLFSQELRKFIENGKTATILFSSVTDPYQPAESKLCVTQKMLEICASYGYEGMISILTKSPLVLRDLSIIQSLKNKEVGLTISHVVDHDLLVKKMEMNAPGARARLMTLEKLNQQGVKTYAFIGPLMPHLFENLAQVEEIFKQISHVGTQEIFVEYLNITPYIKERIMNSIDRDCKFFMFYNNLSKYNLKKEDFDKITHQYIDKYNLKLRLSRTIIH